MFAGRKRMTRARLSTASFTILALLPIAIPTEVMAVAPELLSVTGPVEVSREQCDSIAEQVLASRGASKSGGVPGNRWIAAGSLTTSIDCRVPGYATILVAAGDGVSPNQEFNAVKNAFLASVQSTKPDTGVFSATPQKSSSPYIGLWHGWLKWNGIKGYDNDKATWLFRQDGTYVDDHKDTGPWRMERDGSISFLYSAGGKAQYSARIEGGVLRGRMKTADGKYSGVFEARK